MYGVPSEIVGCLYHMRMQEEAWISKQETK